MKYLIILTVAVMVGCNLVALEAEDPQYIWNDNPHDILGNWYLESSDIVRLKIHAYSIDYKDNTDQKGFFKSVHMPFDTQYHYSNDTLHIIDYGEKVLSFVRK